LSLVFLFSSVAFAKKQPAEQAIISWYEGPVRDWCGGSCAYHPDGCQFLIGILIAKIAGVSIEMHIPEFGLCLSPTALQISRQ
jgi:hypothetical protein